MAQKSDSIILEEEIDPNYVPTEEEVLEYAKWLGMDLVADQELFWIAKEGLKAPLPEHWKPCKTTDTGEIYYFNFSTGESTWDHPCDEHYRKLYEEEKRRVVTEQKASADVFKAQAKRDVEILLGKDKKKKGRKKRTDAVSLSATAPAPVQVTPIREQDRKVLPTLSSSRELSSPTSMRPASAPTTLGYTKVSALAAAAATANARASAELSQEHGTHAHSERQAEIDRLQQRIEELTREQEQKADELQNQITELQDENDHLRDSVHEWKQKYETSKASKCHKCEQLQLRLDANIERTENATKLADDLRREAADLRQQLLAAEEDNQSLGAKLANAEQEMARLGAAPKRAEERVRELEAARQEQAGLIDRLQKSVTTLESTVRQQAQAEMRTAQDATAKQAQLEMQCEVLRKSRDAALRDAELLKEQLQQTTANIRAWEQLRQSHAETLSTLQQNQAELQGVRVEYEQFKISAQEKLDIANDELASLRQELLDRQAEQEALEKEWDTVQLQLRDARTTIQAELSEEGQRYGELLKQLQAANEYSAQLEARVATLTAELEAAVAEKNTSQGGATANVQTKEADSQAESERHAEELAELARKHEEELQQETERSESQIQQLRANKLKELQELEKSIDLQFQAQHARQSEVDELATQLAQRSADLSLQLQQLDADFVDLASVRSALVSAEEAKRRTHDELVQLNEVVARQATELQSLKAAQSSHTIPAVDVRTESRATQSESIACPQCTELKEQYQRVQSEKEATFVELHILQGQLQQANERIQQLQHQHNSTAATRQQVIDEVEAKYQQQKSQSEGLAAKLAMVSQELADVKRVLEAHQETSTVSPSGTDHMSHQQQPRTATDARVTLQTLELLRDLVTEIVRSQLSTAAFGQRDDQEQINPNVQRATDNENENDEGRKCRSKPHRHNKIPSEQAEEVDEDDDNDIADGISDSDSEHSGDSVHAHDSLTEQSFDRMENELRQVLDQEQRKLVRMRLQYSNDKQILQAERERLAELKSTLKRRSARKQSSRKSSHDREYRQLSKQLQSLNHKIAENRRLKQLILEKEGRVARLRKALSLVERLYDTHSTLDDEESKLDFSVTPSKTSPPRDVPLAQPHTLMRAWAGPLTGLQSDNTNNIRHQRQLHHWAKQQVETQYRAEQHATWLDSLRKEIDAQMYHPSGGIVGSGVRSTRPLAHA